MGEEEEEPVVDGLQLKRIAAAVGARALTDEARSDENALVRPNRRGRIPVINVEKWLAPQLPDLEPPQQHKKDRAVTIDLSGCVLGSTGAQVLAGCLQAPPLRPHEASGGRGVTELNLSGCGLGDAALAALAAAPLYWENHDQKLEIHRHKYDHRHVVSLSLAHNKFGKPGLKSLCQPALGERLRALELSDNDIGTPGALAVLSAALADSHLTSLCLARCQIGSSGCLALGSNELPETLTSLDLSGNRITRSAEVKNLTAKLDYDSTGWTALCERLQISNITCLRLASTGIGPEGASVLAERGMRDWQQCKLLLLDLSDNSLRSAGVVALSKSASQTPIRQLLLGGNEISASGLSGMCEAYIRAARLRGKLVGMTPTAVRELDLTGLKDSGERSGVGTYSYGHWQAQLGRLLDELPGLRFLTVNLGRYKAYTFCAEGADRCVYCGSGATPVHYAPVGDKCRWCEACSRKQQADAEAKALARLDRATQELEAHKQKLEGKAEESADEEDITSAARLMEAARASVQLAQDFVMRTKRRKGPENVVLSLRLDGAGLSPADGLLIGAWLAQPTQAATLQQLSLNRNQLLSRVVLQRADGVGASDEAEMLGLHAIASALRASSVTSLHLISCEVGPVAMQTLAQGLPNCLEELDVSANPLKSKGLRALGAELPRVNLTRLTIDLGQKKRVMRADTPRMDLAGEEIQPDDLMLLGGWLCTPNVRGSLTELILGKRSDFAHYSIFSTGDLPPERGWRRSDGSEGNLSLSYHEDVSNDAVGVGAPVKGPKSLMIQGAGETRFNGTYKKDGEHLGKCRYRKQADHGDTDENKKTKKEKKPEEIVFFSRHAGTRGMWCIGLINERDETETDEPPKIISLGNRLLTRNGSGAEATMHGIVALARALPGLTRLRFLSLHKTSLGPVAMKHLAPALPPNLRKLDVSGNRLGAAGKAVLGAQLRRLGLEDGQAGGLKELRVDLGRGRSLFSQPKVAAHVVPREHVKAGYCGTVGGRACEVIDPGQQRRVTRCSEEGVRSADMRIRWLDNSNECYVQPQQLHAIVCSRSDLICGPVDSCAVLVASSAELCLVGLTLLPEDALLLAGWLLSSTVRSSVEVVNLSENRLVSHTVNGPELTYSGALFKGSVADAYLRPLGCSAGILERHDWADDIGKRWKDSEKFDAIARATVSWAVQTVLETGQKEPDGSAQLWATTDSSRGIGACVCHWAVGMEALCASMASLGNTREIHLCDNGIGPVALTCLALHGIGNGPVQVVDLCDNPLVVLDWQGNELPEEMQPLEALLRRSFGVPLRPGLLGLRAGAPQVVAPQTTAGGPNLGCTTLALSGTHFGPLGLSEMYKLQASTLETLELGRNASLGRHGKKLLAEALRGPGAGTKNTSLVRLKKLVIDLGSVTAVVLCDTTTELNLREKRLESADLSIVGACLSTGVILHSLTALDVSRNAAISDTGKIALAVGLAAGDAPTIQSGCFGFGRIGEHVLYLDAQADKIDMPGRGLTFGDVVLLAACISPKQRCGEKAMGVGIVDVDLSDNGLGDMGVSPMLAAIEPAEAARQLRSVTEMRDRAADAKQAMIVQASRLGVSPELTAEEEEVASRAKLDEQMKPLLLALANGAVQPPDDDRVWGFHTSSVPPPHIKSLWLAGNNLGSDARGGVLQPDPDGPQVRCGAIGLMLCTVLAGGGTQSLERLCLAHNPLLSGVNDQNVCGLSLGLPEAAITWLDLTDCGVGAAGGVALADAVSERPFELVIHKNRLGKEGKAALGQAIPDSKYGQRAAKQAEEDELREQQEEERCASLCLCCCCCCLCL